MYAKKEDYWLNIQNGKYKKCGLESKVDEVCERRIDTYIKTTGDNIVERYLDDDLEETLTVDEEFNQGSFLLASLVPTTYERVSTMGTATLWEIQMRAWSYKHKLAIPAKNEKTEFVGGLSRLLKVGFSTDVLKLDFSSLYPSIQLVHDVFPKCDVTGAMKGMLKYFRDTRIKYKQLAEQYYDTDRKKSESYGNKQLPIKIFINSMFGALGAPNAFPWAEMDVAEGITCRARQYLRLMVRFFVKKGYTPTVLDTDGVNFMAPETGEDDFYYVGKGYNDEVEAGKEYRGVHAVVAEFNDLYMKGEMALGLDGMWPSTINLARKNYALLEDDGSVSLTGNTIKSKKLPTYIEEFLDKSIVLLLNDKGYDFVMMYYSYVEKIYNKQIPLAKIATKARVKKTIQQYINRGTNKNGKPLPKQAHMELAIKNNVLVNLGDTIYYVNNGTRASHGDVQKKGNEIMLNCYMLENETIERNPNMTGSYNVPRAISTFNKRIEPLLVVFNKDVRDTLLVTEPQNRGIYTTKQCELINGIPFEDGDQDTLDEVMNISEQEVSYWDRRGLSPYYMYELADVEWKKSLGSVLEAV